MIAKESPAMESPLRPLSGYPGRMINLRSGLLALAAAVVSSALAVVVNLATEWKANPWAWIAVALLTILTYAVTLAMSDSRRTGTHHPITTVQDQKIGDGSIGIQAGGDVNYRGSRSGHA